MTAHRRRDRAAGCIALDPERVQCYGDYPHLVFAVAVMFLVLPIVSTIISVQLAARVDNLAVFTEMLGTVVFGVLLFVLWVCRPSTHRMATRS